LPHGILEYVSLRPGQGVNLLYALPRNAASVCGSTKIQFCGMFIVVKFDPQTGEEKHMMNLQITPPKPP
jgi:hypothetical protein